MVLRRSILVVAITTGVLVVAAPARPVDACTTNPLDTRCELWAAFADSPWVPEGYGREAAFATAVTTRGAVVTGLTENTASGEFDLFTAGFDHAGSVVWTHRYDNGGYDRSFAIVASPDGQHVYVTGESNLLGSSAGVVTLKYSALSGAMWATRQDEAGVERGTAVAVSPDGGTVYVGAELAPVHKSLSVLAYDSDDGDLEWSGGYQGVNVGSVAGIAVSPDGSRVFITGWTGGANARYATAAFRARVDDEEEELGELLWSAEYEPGSSSDRAAAIEVAPDGKTVYVTGTKLSSGARAVTIAYDADTGAQRWLSAEGPAGGSGWGNDLAVAPDGKTVFVVGDQAAPTQDSMVLALDASTGVRRWIVPYGSAPFVERGNSIVVSPGGGEVYATIQSTANVQNLPSDVVTVSLDATTGAERWVARFNSSTREVSGTTGTDLTAPAGLALSRDGQRLYVGGSFDPLADPTHLATNNVDVGLLAYDA